ncbi:hypothetical protein F5887DRAFT_915611 [Amanita rubescens]|nr:hypothetical protein F5887DRAFT_915611 [Amanita rubescens]
MDAQKPFDASAYSDVILRSCDNVDFFVLESLLRLVSPAFCTLFSSSRDSNLKEKKNDRSVLPVAEDSRTLYYVLSTIYPYAHQLKLNNCHSLLKVGATVQKYKMNTIENKLKLPLSSSAPGCGLGWHHEATLAARKTLEIPLRELPFIDELRNINGADFYGYLDLKFRHERISGEKRKTGVTSKRLSVASSQPQSDTDTLVNRNDKLFEPSKDADAIFRSSDSVDFFVLKTLVSLVSPTIDRKKPTKVGGGLPIFDFDEDSEILRLLLLLIYPHGLSERQIDKLDTYYKLGKAAQKYRMTVIEDKLKQQLLASSFLTDDPLRVFAITITLGWGEVVKAAALSTLNSPLEDIPYVDELKQITGADLYWLVQYKFQCVDAACEIVETESIFASQELHKKGVENSTVKSRTLDKLKICPRGSAIVESCAAELEELEKGVYWDLKVMIKLMKKRDVLAKMVELAIARVPLKVECCKIFESVALPKTKGNEREDKIE